MFHIYATFNSHVLLLPLQTYGSMECVHTITAQMYT